MNRSCAVEGCESKYWGRGFCRNHYQREYRKGNIAKKFERTKSPSKVCIVEFCNKPSKAKELCENHYQYKLRHNEIAREPYFRPEKCSLEGCDQPHYAKGWCQRHYQQVRKGQEPVLGFREVLVRRSGCLVTGCDRKHAAKGFCHTHYSQFRQGKRSADGTDLYQEELKHRIEDTLDLIKFGEVDGYAILGRCKWSSRELLRRSIPKRYYDKLEWK